jgi:hypothetical protein
MIPRFVVFHAITIAGSRIGSDIRRFDEKSGRWVCQIGSASQFVKINGCIPLETENID